MKIFSGLLLLFLIGCSDSKPKNKKQTLDFGYFTIETPNGWKKIKAKGIDSYVGRIAIDNNDTLDFDLGWYSNSLKESEDEIDSVDGFEKINSDSHKRNSVSWDTIDGRRAKIFLPKKSGYGMTGIYMDSLWQAGSDIDRFNLHGDNLNSGNEKLFLQAIKTLKFHKTK